MRNKRLYTVSAINALTGDLEAISCPLYLKEARRLLAAALVVQEAGGDGHPYSGHRLKLYKGERKHRFTPP